MASLCARSKGGEKEESFREIPLTLEQEAHAGGKSGKPAKSPYVSNIVITSKYTVWNFLPKNIWEQMHKAANLYFFLISVVMAIGNLTTLYRGTINFISTFFTLCIMMTISAIIAAFDDRARHRADAQTNSQPALRVSKNTESGTLEVQEIEWRDVKVGNYLVVKGEEDFPADVVPLACSGDEGSCYVSTANLDGETNLKVKSAPTKSQQLLSGASDGGAVSNDVPLLDHVVKQIGRLGGIVKAEPPQKSIHNFQGVLALTGGKDGVEEVALGANQILLRGTRLRNTAWCVGIVVYTGQQTRMAMNSREVPNKVANIERTINRIMLVVVFVQALLALVGDILYNVTLSHFKGLWYLTIEDTILPPWLAQWLSFFVLFSNLMPISLYAGMEACNFAQAFFISNDLEMYDEEQDAPARARSTNLGHELGQVSYVFSDKTGTLTQNIMELKQVSIRGQIFGEIDERRGFHGGADLTAAIQGGDELSRAAEAFFEVLSVSHTVVASTDDSGNIKYEAESPDEGALVEAAGSVGWRFTGRKANNMTIEVTVGPLKSTETYSILALNAFNSTRKRQSVLAQRASGEKVLLVKGADNVMLERAASVADTVEPQLKDFAERGLRTLVLGRRTLSDAESEEFLAAYAKAQVSLEDREGLLAAAAESVEKNLEIVGLTAIEDKLQVGVPQTIEKVRAAGIKLWVLTGDKLETARNIGFSSRVLSNEMDIMILDGETGEGQEVANRVKSLLERVTSEVAGDAIPALLVTGQAIEEVTRASGEKEFLDLASSCRVVIACRVSPAQKAQMVALVRQGIKPTPVTLAIGDGANDVPMIQEAQVGVGIAGREGQQAVNSADFGIAQFRYLQQLLLVHGRWNYRRVCKFTLYSFWKNAVLVLLMFYYVFVSGYVGTSIFENWVRSSYNVVLAVPIVCVGVFDRDVSAKVAVEHPELYETGRLGLDLNARRLIETLLSALLHAIVMAITLEVAYPYFRSVDAGDYYSYGTAFYSWLVITMNYRVGFMTTTWNWVSIAGFVFSFFTYLLFLVVYCFIPWSFASLSPWMYYVPVRFFASPLFWIVCIVSPAFANAMDLVKAYLLLEFFPDGRDLVLEETSLNKDAASEVDNPDRFKQCVSGAKAPRPSTLGPEATKVGASDEEAAKETVPRVSGKAPLSSFVFDHPGGDAKKVVSLSSRHPTAGNTALASLPRARTRTSGTDVEKGKSEIESRRPKDWRIAQQTLPSFQFVLTWRFALGCTVLLGVIFLVFAILLTALTDVTRVELQYDGEEIFDPHYNLKVIDENNKNCKLDFNKPTDSRTCLLQFKLLKDVKAPIRVSYNLDPFYQNHATYLESFSWKELSGTLPDSSTCRTGDKVGDLRQVPCGLQAASLFTDDFALLDTNSGRELKMDRSDIAWSTDVERFENPPGYPDKAGIWWIFSKFPEVVPTAQGVKSKVVGNWLRPSFSAILEKVYGEINEDLKKDQLITFKIDARFRLPEKDAIKVLVLSTKGGLAFPATGFEDYLYFLTLFSVLAAILIMSIRCCCGRAPGRPRGGCCCCGGGGVQRPKTLGIPVSSRSFAASDQKGTE